MSSNLIRILLLIAFLFVSPQYLFAQFAGGSGTDDDPFQVSTVEELQAIRDFPDKHFILINDIDASATIIWNDSLGFEPIAIFSGSLNSQDYIINSLTINRPDIENVGVISRAENSQIKNIGGKKDTTDVILKDASGTVIDISEGLVLDPEEKSSITLNWQTSTDTEGTFRFFVETRYDRDSVTVEVLQKPATVVLSLPENNSNVNTLLPEFSWSEVDRAEKYRLQLALEESMLYDSTLSATAFLPPEKLANGTEYFWRVKASNIGGSSN